MATVYANSAFNLYDINLNTLLGGEATFLDNVGFESYLGRTYQDAYRITSSGGQRAYLLGSGFTVNAQAQPTGGTVQAFQLEAWNSASWTVQSGAEGISLPLVSLYAAVQTPSAGDDLGLIAQALAGNDTFRLSEQNDYVRGLLSRPHEV